MCFVLVSSSQFSGFNLYFPQEFRPGRGGRPPSSALDDTLLNMEICGAKLSQREALVFGVPGASVDNVRHALVRLQMDSTAADCGPSSHPLGTRPVVEKTMIWTELEACSRQVCKAARPPKASKA